MEIVVDHLTRMQKGYICVAGIDLKSGQHIRPVLPNHTRLQSDLLARNGGPFDIASVIDLGITRQVGRPPEMEDHLFDIDSTESLASMRPDKFWDVLTNSASHRLGDIFGSALKPHGQGCAVNPGEGMISLGIFAPPTPPKVVINRYNQIRLITDLKGSPIDLSITDLRFYHDDYRTPKIELVSKIIDRIENNVGVILCMGLARLFLARGDTIRRHWLQVNNIHLEDDPTGNRSRLI